MFTQSMLNSFKAPDHADMLLLPGGTLVYFKWLSNGRRVPHDVTVSAAGYLGETIALAPNVTVGDLLKLCAVNRAALEPVFGRLGFASFLDDVSSHEDGLPGKTRDPNLGPVKAELYWCISATWGEDWFQKKLRSEVEAGRIEERRPHGATNDVDSLLATIEAGERADIQSQLALGTYEANCAGAAHMGSLSRVSFHGKSRATRNIIECENLVFSEGDTIPWSFGGSTPSNIAGLPLSISGDVEVLLEDEPPRLGSTTNHAASLKLPPAAMSLFQVIDGLLYELSFKVEL